MRLVLPLLAAVALVAGCGGGPEVTETRTVGHFDRIAVSDAVDVDVLPGDGNKVTVTAGEKVIDRIATTTRDGVLHVDIHDRGIVIGPDPFDDVRMEASASALDGIRVDGSGDLNVGRIDADDFELEVTGSADLEGSGRVDHLVATIEGAGDVHLFDLVARTARVAVKGAGDAELNVTDDLDLTVEGAGDVTYRGRPRIRQTIEGASDVHPED
jgi:hypothetical protein